MTDGFDYHYPVFSIEEVQDAIDGAKERGLDHVEFEYVHEHEYSEIREMFKDLTIRDQVALIDDFTDREGIDCKELEDFRYAAFEAYWEEARESDKKDFLYEQIEKVLDMGSRDFVEQWFAEEFRVDSPYDQEQMRDFIRSLGWGHLLKGE